jgi:transcriptional regulator with XRE-family HTH domain
MPGIIEFLGMNPSPRPTTFGELLLFYRASHGLRQKELANRLGINPSTLGRWEAGNEPPQARKVEIEAMIAGRSGNVYYGSGN